VCRYSAGGNALPGAGGVGGLAGKPNGTVSVDPAVAEGAALPEVGAVQADFS
jgi:hypothetical protein